MRKLIFIGIFFIFFAELVSASLGISPAIKEFDFAPGEQLVIPYTILSDGDVSVLLSVEGDLSQYATLSKTEVNGNEQFFVTINFPDKIDLPGQHVLGVTARETSASQGTLGTRIEITGVIKINVPYPGKYCEISLSVPTANFNESIPVELKVKNKGTEATPVSAKVFLSALGEEVKTLSFSPSFIEPNQESVFNTVIGGGELQAGDYVARGVVNCDKEYMTEVGFRVGSLLVEVLNFTDELFSGGIQKFYINVKSKWNAELKGVFADVNLSKGGFIQTFRTPPVNLLPWEQSKLETYVDTSDLSEEYKIDVILYYAGKQTSAQGVLSVKRKALNYGYILAIVGIVAVGVVLFLIFRMKRAQKKK